MLENTVTEFDPFASASAPVVQSFDLWGKVEISAWACALITGQGKVPYDPTNPNHRRYTAIDIFIQPLPEIDVKYPKSLEEHWIGEFPQWAKITLPSIKALGIDNVREINGKYARITRVPNGKKYEKKDQMGNLTGEMKDETTFKFLAFYRDEDECRAAYLAAGGQPSANGNGHNVAQVAPEESEKTQAYNIMKVVIANVKNGKTTVQEVQEAIKTHAFYPHISKFYTVDSDETVGLIYELTNILPF